MDPLLIVALGLLSVFVIAVLTMALRRNPPVDVEGWHRRLRVLRDTAQPDAAASSGELMVAETADRNVRVLRGPHDEPDSAEHEKPGTGAVLGESTGEGATAPLAHGATASVEVEHSVTASGEVESKEGSRGSR